MTDPSEPCVYCGRPSSQEHMNRAHPNLPGSSIGSPAAARERAVEPWDELRPGEDPEVERIAAKTPTPAAADGLHCSGCSGWESRSVFDEGRECDGIPRSAASDAVRASAQAVVRMLDGVNVQNPELLTLRAALASTPADDFGAAPVEVLREDVLRWVFALYQTDGPTVAILGTPAEAAAHIAKKYGEYAREYPVAASLSGEGRTP